MASHNEAADLWLVVQPITASRSTIDVVCI